MAKSAPNRGDKDDRQIRRAAYVRPRLREFGPVGMLTQAGTGATSEAMVVGQGMVVCSGNSMHSTDPRC